MLLMLNLELNSSSPRWCSASSSTKSPNKNSKRKNSASAAALDLIAALVGARPARLVVNARNDGAISDLPDDLVVEVLSEVDATGARPIPIAPLGAGRVELIRRLDAFGRATIKAALSGDRDEAIDALALNPVVPSRDVAAAIGGELLAAHAANLPNFAR